MRTKRPALSFCLSLSVDFIEPDSGMNPAEAAEEAPSDPDTDAFFKTGRKSRTMSQKGITTGGDSSQRRLERRLGAGEHEQEGAERRQIRSGHRRREPGREEAQFS